MFNNRAETCHQIENRVLSDSLVLLFLTRGYYQSESRRSVEKVCANSSFEIGYPLKLNTNGCSLTILSVLKTVLSPSE